MESLLIEWNPKFEIGIKIIDEQHKFLVELCSKLNNAVLEKNEDQSVCIEHMKQALKSCADYVKFHFSEEEKLMKQNNYPNYSEHKKRHDEFTMKVITTAGKFDKMDKIEALRFVRFLYEWILTHIAHEDQLLAKYIH